MTSENPNDYIPESYEDLYSYYIEGPDSLCSAIIRKKLRHVTDEEIEVLRHDVFVRILEKDLLERYDPAKANFGGVIYFVTRSIVSNHLDRKGRNPLTGLNGGTLVEYDTDEDNFEPGMYNLGRMFSTAVPDYASEIDARDMVARLIEWATELTENGRSKRDRSILPLIELMAEQRDTRECADALGVTASTIFNWIRVIREKAIELRAV